MDSSAWERAPGDLVAARFEVERLVGAGSMGVVYCARDRHSGALVALKLLLCLDEERVCRFIREAHVLAELSHPGIVDYLSHGQTEEGRPYLAMEWLEGEPLSSRLAGGPLPLQDAVILVRRVAEALAFAHEHGVVHRDVKPQNLFLPGGSAERVKLLDFGLARPTRAELRLTHSGDLLGTPAYMSPEQALCAKEIEGRADVFALGAVLFELVVGRVPFLGPSFVATLAKILLEEAPRARESAPQLPEALDELIGWMLAKEPDERPRAGAVAEALGKLSLSLERASPSTLHV